MADAKIGWRINSTDVNWVIDMNRSEWKSFVGLTPDAELTRCAAIAYSPGFPYPQSDRASMPSRYPVMGSGALTIANESQHARVSLAVFHDRKDRHWNLWAYGWTTDNKPVCRRDIEGHQLNDTNDIELIVRLDKQEKHVTIEAEDDLLP